MGFNSGFKGLNGWYVTDSNTDRDIWWLV